MLVEIHEMTREVVTCDSQPFDLLLVRDGSVKLQPKGQTSQATMHRAGQVVSLQLLRQLSLTSEQRFAFFCDYINGTYRTDMCPVNLVLTQGRLRYHMMTHPLDETSRDTLVANANGNALAGRNGDERGA